MALVRILNLDTGEWNIVPNIGDALNIDLTNYYTKNEINNLLEDLEVEVDLSNYYTKLETDTKISEEIDKMHIPTHLSELSQNASYRTVTDDEKETWNAKETTAGAQDKADNALASAKTYTETQTSNALTSAKGYTDTEVGAVQNDLNAFKNQKGAYGGLAELDEEGYVPSYQLPSYVDDVLIYENYAELPQPGETGKIYVTRNDNITYRWGDSDYVEISKSLALGTTTSTAYPGNKGKANRDDINTILNTYATQNWVEGKNYVNTTLMNSTLLNYAKTSDIPSLAGYATQSWVENKNYAKVTDIPAVPTDLSAFNNDVPFLTFQDVQGNYVPTTRTINGKSLSANITLTASDVGATNTYITSGNYSEVPPGKRWVPTSYVSSPTYSVGTTASEPDSDVLPSPSGLSAGTTGHVYTQSLPMQEAYYIVQEIEVDHGLITLTRNSGGKVEFTIPKPDGGGSSDNFYPSNLYVPKGSSGGLGILKMSMIGTDDLTVDMTHNHDAYYYREAEVDSLLSTKVDKVSGKGLSTNDFTSTLKNKLDGIETGANNYSHPTYTARSSALRKITVDSTGHVSAVASVTSNDVPSLPISKITNLQTELNKIPTTLDDILPFSPGEGHMLIRASAGWTSTTQVPDSTRWNDYRMRVGNFSSGESGSITFGI